MDFSVMTRKELLAWILGGLGTDASRSRASYELLVRFGCSSERRDRLFDRGWWAARKGDKDLAF